MYNLSNTESEDGEIEQGNLSQNDSESSFNEDEDALEDSLDIKPPQATVKQPSSRSSLHTSKKHSKKHDSRHREHHRTHRHRHSDSPNSRSRRHRNTQRDLQPRSSGSGRDRELQRNNRDNQRERESNYDDQERKQREWRKNRLLYADQEKQRNQRKEGLLKRRRSPERFAVHKKSRSLEYQHNSQPSSPKIKLTIKNDVPMDEQHEDEIDLEVDDSLGSELEEIGDAEEVAPGVEGEEEEEEEEVDEEEDEDEEEEDEEEEAEDVKNEDEYSVSEKSSDSSKAVEESGEEESDGDKTPEQDITLLEKNGATDTEEEEEEEVIPQEKEEVSEQDKVLQEIRRLPPYYPALQGCRNVDEFTCLNKIEEGTYGVVFRARDKRTQEVVALKKLKMDKEKEGFPITSLREISTLLKAQHLNIVTVREIVVGWNIDKIYIVMDYVEHDLKSLMESMKEPFLMGEVKTLMLQLLSAVAHIHDNWILHRDLKTSNLLLGHDGILKVGDFGLAREYGSPLKAYTSIVVTLWYRAPELLLDIKKYSTAIDMWSVGCIFAELLTMKPLFPGKSEIDQLTKIVRDLGTPNDTIWPGYSQLTLAKKIILPEITHTSLAAKLGGKLSPAGLELILKMLCYDPAKRITAEEALKHEFFKEIPKPIHPSLFPTWPAKSEHPKRKNASPKPPPGGKQFDMIMQDENGVDGGFHMTRAHEGKASRGAGGFALKF